MINDLYRNECGRYTKTTAVHLQSWSLKPKSTANTEKSTTIRQPHAKDSPNQVKYRSTSKKCLPPALNPFDLKTPSKEILNLFLSIFR
jgi:hypothetical protein